MARVLPPYRFQQGCLVGVLAHEGAGTRPAMRNGSSDSELGGRHPCSLSRRSKLQAQ